MVKALAWMVIGVSLVWLALQHGAVETASMILGTELQQHSKEIGQIQPAPKAEGAPLETRAVLRPNYGHVHTAHCR